MRMCSLEDLSNDEATGTGCGLDVLRVWAASTSGCPRNTAVTVAGSRRGLAREPVQCVSKSGRQFVRCCADVFFCSNNECATDQDPLNKCVTRGDTYKCVCNTPVWTPNKEESACVPSAVAQNTAIAVQAAVEAAAAPTQSSSIYGVGACSSDPCGRGLDSRNTCVLLGDSYRCVCAYPAFVSTADDKACAVNPCSSRPCEQGLAYGLNTGISTPLPASGSNICIPLDNGLHRCVCSPPLVTSANGLSCLPPEAVSPVVTAPPAPLEGGGRQTGLTRRPTPVSSLPPTLRPLPAGTPPTYARPAPTTKGVFTYSPTLPRVPSPPPSPRVNACLSDPCSSADDSDNFCIDSADGTYTCSCGAFRYKNSRDGQSCIFVPDACSGDPCQTAADRANICLDNFDGSYSCLCKGEMFLPSTGAQGCYKVDDVCASDPCQTGQDIRNRCEVDEKTKDSYSCVCGGTGFAASPDKGACERVPVPCDDNPCKQLQDNGNKCVDNGDGTHQCVCNGARYRESPDFLSCDYVADACANNPCASLQDLNNVCTDNKDNTNTCRCDGLGWQANSQGNRCILRPSPCRALPCKGDKDPLNVCRDHRNGTYHCECDSTDYSQSADTSTCDYTPNLCALDPCHARLATNNSCTNNGDGTYECLCGDGWLNEPTGGVSVNGDAEGPSCLRIPKPCNRDPCFSRLDLGNQCVDLNDGVGGYRCVCGGVGFLLGEGSTSCISRDNPCDTDPCSAKDSVSSGNLCLDNRDGTYTCSCDAKGWAAGPGSQSCVAPSDPCRGLSQAATACGTDMPGNECVDNRDGTFYCVCRARGWASVYDRQRCVEPRDRCALGDPCLTKVAGVQNVCTNNRDGTLTCKCDSVKGYSLVPGGKKCKAPVNQCLVGDPCKAAQDKANTCTDFGDGTYACACGGYDWEQEQDYNGHDVCAYHYQVNKCWVAADGKTPADPCLTREDSSNSCSDMRQQGFKCNCALANGWRTGPDQQSCLPPLNPCKEPGGNFCGDVKYNVCVYMGRGKYRCDCMARGYTEGKNLQLQPTCEEPQRLCPVLASTTDPCRTEGGGGNQCLDNLDGTYACRCNKQGHRLAKGGRRCLPPPDPCLQNDPCKASVNRQNYCEGKPDGTHVCRCRGRGWTQSNNKQACLPPKNSCVGDEFLGPDPCRTEDDPANRCIDKADGTHICKCDGEDFYANAGFQVCECKSPCLMGDPCAQQESDQNTCTETSYSNDLAGRTSKRKEGPNHCGTYTCTCNAFGWKKVTTDFGTERCVPPQPCSDDPCLSRLNSANKCIPSYDGASQRYDPATDPLNPINVRAKAVGSHPDISVPGPASSSASAAAAAAPFSSSYFISGSSSANAVPSPFAQQQQQAFSPFSALQQQLVSPPGVSSSSSAFAFPSAASSSPALVFPQWPGAVGGRRRRLLVHNDYEINVFGTDATKMGANPASFYEAGSFFCQCDGVGWVTPVGAQTCKPPNPCEDGDPCGTFVNRDNKCVPSYSTSNNGRGSVYEQLTTQNADFFCECNAETWYPSPDHKSCLPCPNMCDSLADPCSSFVNSNNTCVWSLQDQPDIRRQGTGGGASLRRSHNLGVSGTTLQGNSNLGCGDIQCTCDTRNGWIEAVGKRGCFKCDDPCRFDPCKGNSDGANTCRHILPTAATAEITAGNLPPGFLAQVQALRPDGTFKDPCGIYVCTCAGEGWVTPQGAQTCERCIDPCSRDPCGTTQNPNNVCVSSGASQVLGGRRRLLQRQGNAFSDLDSYSQLCSDYKCVCGGAGFIDILDGSQCSQCQDPCDKADATDPCLAELSSENKCVSLPNPRPGQTTFGGFGPQPAAVGRRLLSEAESRFLRTNKLGPNLPDTTAIKRHNQAKHTAAAPNRKLAQASGFASPPAPPLASLAPFVTPSSLSAFPFSSASSAFSPFTSSTPFTSQVSTTSTEISRAPAVATTSVVTTSSVLSPLVGSGSSYGPGAAAADGNAAFPADLPVWPVAAKLPPCGVRQCVCGEGFVLSGDKQSCSRVCVNKCTTEDPCNSRLNAGNKCVWNKGGFLGQCGFVKCSCAPGWTPTFGAQGCAAPVDAASPCVTGDPCQTTSNPQNKCLPSVAVTAGFQCSCAEGFTAGIGGLSCVTAGPVSSTSNTIGGGCIGHDNCAMAGNPANVCITNGGSYTCNCFQSGFRLDFSNAREIKCVAL